MGRRALILILVGLMVVGGAAARAQGDDVFLPPFTHLPPGWHILKPGGQTACADGSPYSFLVYRGRSDRLLIYFQGGGACWDNITCRDTHNYDSRVDLVESNDNPVRQGDGMGIFDLDNPANPFADFSVIYIPYCTGDMHMGDNIVDYDETAGQYMVLHRGAPNARDVLDWVYRSISDPESIVVLGCSAGGMGAAYHAPFIMAHYPDVPVVVLADSAGGYRGDLSALFTAWRTTNILPGWIPGFAGSTPQTMTFARLFTAPASAYPAATFAQFNSAGDMTQAYYNSLGINGAEPLRQTLAANLWDIHHSAPNFYSYTVEGDIHCLLPRPEFYEFAADGVPFRDWVAALVNGAPAPDVFPPGFGLE